MKCPQCDKDIVDDSKFCKECGTNITSSEEARPSITKTIETPREELTTGSSFAGRYQIIEELGKGGMGRVYKALDTKINEKIALKLIRPEIAKDKKTIERFRNELRLARKIRHKNVCQMFDLGEERGTQFITMEYVPGEDLRSSIRRFGQLPIGKSISIANQICEGLAEAHRLDVVHRDLKSNNIMIDDDGNVRIMDFGIARSLRAKGITGTGVMIGTPEYMSPEQVEGKNVDQRSDIYSLGIILFEMVTGKVPFEGDTPFTIGIKHKSEPPTEPKQINVQIPESLNSLILKCLEKDRNLRYQSCEDLLNHLKSTDKDLRTTISDIIMPPKSVGLRWKRVVIFGGSLLVILAISVIWLILNNSRSRWSKDTAIAEIEDLVSKDNYAEAFILASEAESHIPDSPTLGESWPKLSGRLSIISTPLGADVYVRGYSADRDAWQHIGKTPLDEVRIPKGVLHWKIESPGYETFETVGTFLYPRTKEIKTLRFVLEEKDTLLPGMMRIPEKELFVDFNSVPASKSYSAPAYQIDRYEVTNKSFKQFVDYGGYQNPEYWKYDFIKNGQVLSWEQAMAEFRDKSGRPGPVTWTGGTYPKGQENYPVAGVCWYEATAYAEFVGRSLPTIYHWFGVIDTDLASYITPMSNFESSGPMPVGHYPGVGPYGLLDMAGNVREWCWNELGDLRFILGGAWTDPEYMFYTANAQSPFDRSPINGFRCVKYPGEGKEVLEQLKRPYSLPAQEEVEIEQVSDEIFKIYRGQYHYDKSPLNVRVESTDESPEYWKVETISFSSTIEDERFLAHLFIPKNVRPPYQTVVYFPGSGAQEHLTSDNIQIHIVDFIVMSGRAVVYPVYKGTYERSEGFEFPSSGTQRYVDYCIQLVNEVRRTLDYLETRNDIDLDKIAFWGYSWGAALGPIVLATEDRFRLGLFLSGGISIKKKQPVINITVFAPRVEVPILMVNGKHDYIFQLETSQQLMFDLLGTKAEDKEHFQLETGHSVFATHRQQAIEKVLDWLDRYLGRVF
jgi:serine/threonine protein kinase/predicted esterase